MTNLARREENAITSHSRSAIAPVSMPTGVAINSLEDCIKIGGILAQSGFFNGANTEQKAVAKILRGWELGIPPVAALENVNVIDGRTSLSANLIASLIKRSKRYNYRVKELSSDRCTLVFMEAGETCGEYTFTMEEARNAGLGNDKSGNFSKYSAWYKTPKRMLFARCITQGANTYCPDITHGEVVAAEEVEDSSTVADHDPQPIEFRATDTWHKFVAAIAQAETPERIDELDALARQRIAEGVLTPAAVAHDAVDEEVAIARSRLAHTTPSAGQQERDAMQRTTEFEVQAELAQKLGWSSQKISTMAQQLFNTSDLNQLSTQQLKQLTQYMGDELQAFQQEVEPG